MKNRVENLTITNRIDNPDIYSKRKGKQKK